MSLSLRLHALWTKLGFPRITTARRRHRLSGLAVEQLEDRRVPSAVGALVPASSPVVSVVPRSIDGTGNNVTNPAWGSVGADLLRKAPAAYGDGISTPAGANRPSARVISNTLSAHPEEDLKNDRYMSNLVYAWGQFIDHDLDLTTSGTPRTAFNIAVPKGDAQFDPLGTGTQVISLSRSGYKATTGLSVTNPRQQENQVTAFLDASMVYGSDATRAAALRTFAGGKLKTSEGGLLPSNTAGLANANDTHQTPDNQLFLGGDVRANENIELTALQTLFVREHNRICDRLAKENPKLTEEQIYQRARAEVIAEVQAITFNEFLPALMGRNAPGAYTGYNSKVNPGIANEFSTAAFRFGHSMLGNDVEFLDNNGVEIRDPLALKDVFFNPAIIRESGIDPILKYLASDRAEEIDLKVVDSVRNFLFGAPGAGGLDLPALNIQRGRDHGLADYNTTRAAYGLPKVKSFAEITPDVAVQQQLKTLYNTVDNIDLWAGGLAEAHLPGGSLGATFSKIVGDQFQRLRAGDSHWYQRTFKGADLARLEHTTLSDVIRHNTQLTNLQDNAFVFHAAITGRVLAPRANRRTPPQGIGGQEVQLVDAEGVVTVTTSQPDGSYLFDALSPGTYQISQRLPGGRTSPPRTVQITRGMIVDRQDFMAGALAHPPQGSQFGTGHPHRAHWDSIFDHRQDQ